MSDFVDLPLQKLLNRQNPITRIENLERGKAAPSARVGQLGQIGQGTGSLVVDESIVVVNRTDGLPDVTINDTGIIFRNQEGRFVFVDTSGNENTVEAYIDGSDNLTFKNAVGSGTSSIRFHVDDTAHNVIQFYFDELGLEMPAGSIYVRVGNVQIDTPGADLYYGSLAAHEGFFPVSETWTRTGTHSFTVPSNLESRYRKGTKLAYTDAGVGEYGVVGSSVFVTTDNATTVTLIPNTDYGMSTDTIADPHVSYADNPLDFPDWFNFDAAPSGFSAVPASPSYRWRTSGRCIFISYGEPNNGTSNATTFTATVPVAPVNAVTGVAGTLVDNGTVRTVAGRVTIGAGSTTMIFRTDMASGAWTNANGKRGVAALFYEY
jgi:hypothetical protein